MRQSEIKEVIVPLEGVGQRLDIYLSHALDWTRSQVKSSIEHDNVLVNQQLMKAGTILKLNDVLQITLYPKENIEYADVPFEIIYEDEYLMVINKPRGLVVHPAPSYHDPTLVNGILNHLKDQDDTIRPGIVHRIDKDTTGLLVVAKDVKTHEFLSKNWKDHKVERHYLCLVHGIVNKDGRIDTCIGRDPKTRTKFIVTNQGKRAITYYRVLQNFDKFTLLEVTLETGRTHQIRVHFNYLNHWVVGDKLYGRPETKEKLVGQLLHAQTLVLIHPITKEKMSFVAPIPQDFDLFLKKLTPIKEI